MEDIKTALESLTYKEGEMEALQKVSALPQWLPTLHK